MGMDCEVFMGKEDTERQALNVYKMRLLGAVAPVTSGTRHLEGRSERDHARVDPPHRRHPLCARLGHGSPPLPPTIVRDFQAVISREIKQQLMERRVGCPTRCWPAWAAAPTPSAPFTTSSREPSVRLIGCERPRARGAPWRPPPPSPPVAWASSTA